MTEGGPTRRGYVSPYLQTPPRSLAEAERDRRASDSPARAESNDENRSSSDKAGKR
jgi:hypothetical protein